MVGRCFATHSRHDVCPDRPLGVPVGHGEGFLQDLGQGESRIAVALFQAVEGCEYLRAARRLAARTVARFGRTGPR